MNKEPITRLIFVFDAESGLFGAVIDSARKMLLLNGCALCSLTHGVAGERTEWRTCKEEIGVPIAYHHRDDLPALVKAVATELPCVVAEVDGSRFEVLLPRASLVECRGSVSELKARIFIRALSKGLELAAGEHCEIPDSGSGKS